MGYPVVTRLGINQFWYRHWYTDTFYKQSVQQDSIFENFIMLYVNYGTTFKNSTFIHEYWYTKPSRNIRTLPSKSNEKYYRKCYHNNSELDVDDLYTQRNDSGEYFPMRCWVLKYGGWIILSLKFFKPLKIKNSNQASIRRKTSLSSVTSNLNYRINNKRLSLVYSLAFKQLKLTNKLYCF